ncbi:MAG: hypothetical protein ACRCTI_10780 [Beijerinckiaceae bacterium]
MPRAPLVAAMLLALASPVVAQTSSRFTFQPVDGGMMRLDTETGHVSLCTKSGDSYACRSVADDRAAMQEEIDRLKRDNEALRRGGVKPQEQTGKLQLPSEEDIDKAMGLFERMMRRMMRTFRDEGGQTDRL